MFYFLSYNFVFFFLSLLFAFSCFDFSWCGLFLYVDSYVFVSIIFISIFIYGLILFSEGYKVLVKISQILILISFLFFIPHNFFFFYIFFELSIFPILVMILGYGFQVEKVSASFYLIFYTCFCSFPFLFVFYRVDFSYLFVYFDFIISWELVFILSITFIIKFPVFFLHLWLPKAHVEAPTSASMILAGLLLKFGTIGFFRIMKSLNFCHVNFFIFISLVGMLISSLCCIFQSDSKSLAAYSSVTHMRFLLFSFLFFSLSGKMSSVLIIIAHGYTSTLIFYFIGNFYHVVGSRIVYYFNSLFLSNIFICLLFSGVFLSNAGVPPSLSFFSEFMTIRVSFIVFSIVFVFLFFYFMVSFYYSIYFIVNLFIGKVFFFFNSYYTYYSFFLFLMCFNVFWFFILF